MSEKVALITGGSSGIGRAACLQFAQIGCRVVIADTDAAGAEETLQQLQVYGGQELGSAKGVLGGSWLLFVPLVVHNFHVLCKCGFGVLCVNRSGICTIQQCCILHCCMLKTSS